MGYSTYIGRVGALAVALGIGVAVANTPGVAWAEPSESSSSKESSSDRRTSPPLSPRSQTIRAAERDAQSADDPDDVDEHDPADEDSDDEEPDTGGMKVSAQTTTTTDRGASKAVNDDAGVDEDRATNTVEGKVVADEPSVDPPRSRPHRLRWYRSNRRRNLFRKQSQSRGSAVRILRELPPTSRKLKAPSARRHRCLRLPRFGGCLPLPRCPINTRQP